MMIILNQPPQLLQLRGGQIFPFIFRINVQQQNPVPAHHSIINDSRAAAFAVAFGGHAQFSQPGGFGNNFSRVGSRQEQPLHSR
jgi:hypothetical protein